MREKIKHLLPLVLLHLLALVSQPVQSQIYINELPFTPLGGGQLHEYLELRGTPGSTVGPGTHLIWITGDTNSPGKIRGSGLLTGSAAEDWVAARLTGTSPNWVLGIGDTLPSVWEGVALDHIGGANPQLAIFTDGFESGDITSWSGATPGR